MGLILVNILIMVMDMNIVEVIFIEKEEDQKQVQEWKEHHLGVVIMEEREDMTEERKFFEY